MRFWLPKLGTSKANLAGLFAVNFGTSYVTSFCICVCNINLSKVV